MVGDPPMGKGSKLEIMHLSVCAQISLTTDFYIYDVFNTRFLYLHLPVQVARGVYLQICVFFCYLAWISWVEMVEYDCWVRDLHKKRIFEDFLISNHELWAIVYEDQSQQGKEPQHVSTVSHVWLYCSCTNINISQHFNKYIHKNEYIYVQKVQFHTHRHITENTRPSRKPLVYSICLGLGVGCRGLLMSGCSLVVCLQQPDLAWSDCLLSYLLCLHMLRFCPERRCQWSPCCVRGHMSSCVYTFKW